MKDFNVSVIYDYDQSLLEDGKSMAPFFFQETYFGAEGVHDNAVSVIRYAIEELLRWTPKMMVENFNGQVIKDLKLHKAVAALNKDFPVQLNKKRDYYYYAHMVYPDTIRITEDYLTIKTYRDLLDGKIQRLQKGFLEGDDGEGRIRLCLNYKLNMVAPSSIRGLYYDFSSTQRGNKILSDWKLNTARRSHYKHPIDFLHASLPEEQRDEFLYHYYKFKSVLDTLKQEEKEQLKREEKTKKKEDKEAEKARKKAEAAKKKAKKTKAANAKAKRM